MQEALQHVPLPLIGVDTEGMIAVSNQAADTLCGEGAPLLGRFIDECLPAGFVAWFREAGTSACECEVGGLACRVSRRAMGGLSASRGVLLVFDRVGEAAVEAA
jgi:hypothetical protein